MSAALTDPYHGFKFRVEIHGIQVAAFSEVTVPDISIEPIEYREGTDPNHKRSFSGLTSYGSVTLKKGITDSMELYDWQVKASEEGTHVLDVKKNLSIVLLDSNNKDACRWDLFDAWPTKYEGSGLNAANGEVFVESLELKLDHMKRVK